MKDLTSQRFGWLIAVRPTVERSNGSVVWECKCDCGNTTFVNSSNLQCGNTKSCGCLKKLSGADMAAANTAKNIKDLTGQRFGRLVAVQATEKRRCGSVVWECKCDCGNTAFTASAELCHGKTRSCGCLQKETAARNGRERDAANAKDLTGRKIGRLTVIGRTKTRKGTSKVWECKCDCGRMTYYSTYQLESGRRKSCGCLRKEYLSSHGKGRFNDLSGQRFGRLVAVRPMEERKRGVVVWECKCDCGNTVFIASAVLKSGGNRSCGCLRKENARKLRKHIPEFESTK